MQRKHHVREFIGQVLKTMDSVIDNHKSQSLSRSKQDLPPPPQPASRLPRLPPSSASRSDLHCYEPSAHHAGRAFAHTTTSSTPSPPHVPHLPSWYVVVFLLITLLCLSKWVQVSRRRNVLRHKNGMTCSSGECMCHWVSGAQLFYYV